MREDASGRRQRAVMATDAEWERIGRAAAESGMDLSRFVIHRALDWDPLPAEVLRRAVREMLVLSSVKRLSILTPDRRAKLTPLSGTAEVVPVANRGDPRGFV